ncbi:MAG: efflux RND transporter periplasmic adaptor subunit [Proteobacteria bacterium]|nr:efflux RND transporter periplasmic adaptor subunit [Pseudomonadota bacterium]
MSRPSSRRLLLVAAVASATLAACGQQQGGGGFHGFPPAQVTTETVQPVSLPVSFEYTGQTIGSKDVEVRARVTGIVEHRAYQEGSAVKAGQLLFTIDPKPYEAKVAAAEAELARAQAQKAQADREYARLKPLAERHAVGQKEADDAQSNADLAAAAIKAAQANVDSARLDLGYTRAVSPINGLSSRAQVSEGALATANQTLLTVVSQVDPIWVTFNVSDTAELKLNREVAEGRLALPANNAYDVAIKLGDGTTFPRKGTINFSDTRVDPSTGTVELRAEIANKDLALKPGQFVRVTLTGATRKNAIVVPQTAVLDSAQGKFVYVAGKDKDGKDIALPRPVVLGDWVDASGKNQFVIESGLKAGDVVLVDGIAKVMPNGPIILGGAPGAPGGAPAKAAPAEAKKS